jgi:hypothetical protein
MAIGGWHARGVYGPVRTEVGDGAVDGRCGDSPLVLGRLAGGDRSVELVVELAGDQIK